MRSVFLTFYPSLAEAKLKKSLVFFNIQPTLQILHQSGRDRTIQIPKFLIWYLNRRGHLTQMCPTAKKHEVSLQSQLKSSQPDLLMLFTSSLWRAG